MNVSVDADRCRGHGICMTLCPDVFALSDDGYAEVRISDIPEEFHEAIETAAAACPEHAIETD